MSLTGNNILGGASGQTTGYDIDQSLRFNRPDAPYLEKTFSASNRKTWTWSGWFKLADPSVADGSVGHRRFFGTNTGNSDSTTFELGINTDNKLIATGWNNNFRITTAVYRDPSSWYHVVYVFDSTDSTADDRLKMYVNGERITSFTNSYTVTQDADYGVNQSGAHYVGYGGSGAGNAYCMDGYLAEIHFIDGTALTPASFGETNEDTNQWQAIEYAGSYGTNGFYQKYQDSSALGDDSSGNTNDFTATNLVATDQVLDSPTRNYCTLNPLDFSTGTLSEGNLKWVSTGAAGNGAFGSFAFDIASTDNKYYFEVLKVSGDSVIGVVPDNVPPSNLSRPGSYTYYADGDKYSGVTGSTYGASYTDGDIISVAVGAGSITFYKNGASQGVAFTGLTGDFKPALYEVTATFVANFGQDSSFAGAKTAQGNGDDGEDFYYTPPTGYKALNTDNLDDPAIALPTDYFDTTLYAGTAATHTISSLAFQPDFLWIKARTQPYQHSLRDSVRGSTKTVRSNDTTAEETQAASVTSFNSDGWSMGADPDAFVNYSTSTYVGWAWKGGGTASSNGDGSITSSVSANTTAGFSIVSYTGTGANATVGHGLSQTPELIIFKNLPDTEDWIVYSEPVGSGGGLFLDHTNATDADGLYFNSTSPTSSVFTVGSQNRSNGSSNAMIAYAWHSVEGYSKVGSYTGNGVNDGTFVYTGFRPMWVMAKCTDGSGSWLMTDSVRFPYNVTDDPLFANESSAETNSSTYAIDILSNGFKCRGVNNDTNNSSGNVYVYLAFAESPFKTSNAR